MVSTQHEIIGCKAARVASVQVMNNVLLLSSSSQSVNEKSPPGMIKWGASLLLSTNLTLLDARSFPVNSACASVPSANASSSSIELLFVHLKTSVMFGVGDVW